jgi:periplasmic copper chaperone A
MARRVLTVGAAVAVVLVLWSGVAAAHVTVSPSSLPRGTDDAILTFRVPDESTTASVTGLEIEFPLTHPIVLVNPEAGSGWQVSVHKVALPKPVTTDDGTFTMSQIDWSGGSIPVGQFAEFNVLAQGIPTGTDQLVFKAVQHYSDGTSVAWIQVPDQAVPDPPHPAPVVTLTRGDASGSSGTTSSGSSSGATSSSASTASGSPVGSTSGSGTSWQAVVALIVAAFAVVLALVAIWLGRPVRDRGRPAE